MRNSFYFKHDNNARNNKKLIGVRAELGWEGYGICWALIEMLYESGGYLKYDKNILAFALNISPEKIEKVVDSLKKNSVLKMNQGRMIYSEEVLSQLETRGKIIEGGRMGGKKKGKKKAPLKPPLSLPKAHPQAEEERRGEERIEEDRIGEKRKKRTLVIYEEGLISQKDKEEIAEKYQVPIEFVESKLEDLVNYCESTGKKYKDYKATLRNWVKRDRDKLKMDAITKKPIVVKI